MNNTPTDIYAMIIEHFISAHAEPMPKDPNEVKFIPRAYLTPLLRVSKQWYANSAKYLYRSIAIGSRRGRSWGEIAKALLRTVKANPELAALIERLQLGMRSEPTIREEWTQINIDILQLCPNVVHVQIQGYHFSKFNALLSVLEEKSIVSFSISSRFLANSFVPSVGRSSRIFDLMQNWPNLRTFQMQGGEAVWSPWVLSQISGLCPNLREIEITHVFLCPILYRALRTMCSSGVTKFSVWINGEAPHELCECLCAWSATLEYLKIDNSVNSYHKPNPAYLPPLTEVLSTLTELRVLELNGSVVDCGVISNLPRLERICMNVTWRGRGRYEEHVQQLTTLLKNSEKFPSLTHIAGDLACGLDPAVTNEFLIICRGRDIQLGYNYSAFEALFIPTHRHWSI